MKLRELLAVLFGTVITVIYYAFNSTESREKERYDEVLQVDGPRAVVGDGFQPDGNLTLLKPFFTHNVNSAADSVVPSKLSQLVSNANCDKQLSMSIARCASWQPRAQPLLAQAKILQWVQ